MRGFLNIAAAIAVLGACAHMNTNARPDPSAAASLGTNAEIKTEADNLNHITRISIDANRLYDAAADEANDKDLQSALRSISAERKLFAQKLQQRVAALGASPAETGQPSGAVYRSFAALRGLIENDSVAAAGEVYRGESYIIDEMNKTLQTPLTSTSHDILVAELAAVKVGRNRVELLKTAMETRLMNEAAREDAAAQPKRSPANPG